MDKRWIECSRQGHRTMEDYKRHRQNCPRCRNEMARLNAIAKRQTDEQIAEIDRKLDLITERQET